jgi:hypothetical protein
MIWIKCSDTYPDTIAKFLHVIVYSNSTGFSFDAYWSQKSKRFLDKPYGQEVDVPITHWMHFPPKPSDV